MELAGAFCSAFKAPPPEGGLWVGAVQAKTWETAIARKIAKAKRKRREDKIAAKTFTENGLGCPPDGFSQSFLNCRFI